MKKILTLICTLLCANVLMAQTFWVDSLQYEVTSSTWPYQVTVCNARAITIANIPATVIYDGSNYSVTSIGEIAFCDCSSLSSITIPNSVTRIGRYAFLNCSSLTSITIPNSVTSIGECAFKNCSSLTYITIPNSVTSIGGGAFCLCDNLTSVTLSNNITLLPRESGGGYGFFHGCSSLTSITIPNSVTSIGEYAFSGCSSLTSITIPNSVTSIGKCAFYNCSGLTSFTIPNSVTFIGKSAFSSCSSLSSITIPNSVTSIGEEAFRNCSSLTSVDIPNSVTSIGNYTFSGCSSLTSITIPNSITSIEHRAFEDCSSLTSVTIPNSVTSIGEYAFKNCDGLTSVTCLAANPPTLSYYVFYNTPNEKSLIVPCGALDNYINSDWNDCFANIIEEIDFTITANVNNSAFGSVAVESDCSTSTATLTATANEGYKFVRWNDGNTENPRLVTLSSDITFTAIFSEINNSSLMDVEHSELSFYPNPTSGKVTFNQAIEKVEVIDLSGKTLQTYENANEINIESLPAGVYHLRMTIRDKTTTRKIIKE